MHDVVVVVVGGGAGLVVVVVVDVGGGGAGLVVVVVVGIVVVLGAVSLVRVVGGGAAVTTAADEGAVATERWETRVGVVVVDPPGAPVLLVVCALAATGGVVAAAVLGPVAGMGRRRARAGSVGPEPRRDGDQHGQEHPDDSEPAEHARSMRAGPLLEGRAGELLVDERPDPDVRRAAVVRCGPGPVLVHGVPFLVRRRSGGSHQRKPAVARKPTEAGGAGGAGRGEYRVRRPDQEDRP